jgi:DNA-binding NarL/FixJ family response regulator
MNAQLEAWKLTDRQCQVAMLLADGLSNKEIAQRIGCSPRTVEVHVSNLLRRAGCAGRLELVVRMLDGKRGRS